MNQWNEKRDDEIKRLQKMKVRWFFIAGEM